MGWTSPRTWNVGEIVTKALMDLHIRDNLKYLKGESGVPTIESGLIIDNTGGDEYLKLPLLSTAETGTVLTAEGQVAHDEQTNRIKFYDGTAVRSIVSTADVDDTPVDSATTDPISSNWAYDHVAAADPHTGYVLESLADGQGDIFYASADNTWAKLTKGTEGYYLRQTATIPEWASGLSASWFQLAGVISTTTATKYFLSLDSSSSSAPGSESNVTYLLCVKAGTIRNLYARLDANTVDGPIVITVRKNGADQSLTCSIADNTSSASDLVNSFAVVAGDLISVSGTKTDAAGTDNFLIMMEYSMG